MSASPPPSASAPPVNTQSELYGQIFGGDDDDLSDDEDFQPKRQQVAFPPRPTAPPTGVDQDRDEGEEDEDEQDAMAQEALMEDEDDDDDDDGGVYVPATATAPAKIPKFKKKHRDEAADDEEDGEEEVQRKKRKEKKEKRRKDKENRAAVAEEEEEDVAPVYDEATQRRMALEERIDNIGKKAKVVRRKKRGEDVDVSVSIGKWIVADRCRYWMSTTRQSASVCEIECWQQRRRTKRRTMRSFLQLRNWQCSTR